jgi:hypothetical protein
MPEGMVRYTPAKWTQEIAVTDGLDRITPVPIARLEAKWHVSGGMVGVQGWTSEKYKYVPPGGVSWIGNILVKNSLGHLQPNRGILRHYPEGTRFDDVLSNAEGRVFEHRTREKVGGVWKSRVLYKNAAEWPRGYTGLRQSCASCHDEAGSGGYAVGLVPGGDGVLSDALDWTLTEGYQR